MILTIWTFYVWIKSKQLKYTAFIARLKSGSFVGEKGAKIGEEKKGKNILFVNYWFS